MSLPAQAGLVERTFLYSIAGSPKYFFVFGEGEAAVEDYAADVAAFFIPV